MTFSFWDHDTTLQPNRFGIDEPVDAEPVRVDDLDVVVVPAVAVDRLGNRLGFGAGYYDRTLAGRRPGTLVVAAVFSVQVLDEITPRSWDVPVDVVVTDAEVIRTAGSGRT
jgi:5-formyltetrahydrofolate cyclo-ligase